jgi:outer membrane receptor for ferrienterochelin and colicin
VAVIEPKAANSPTIIQITSVMAAARGGAASPPIPQARRDTLQVNLRELPPEQLSLPPLILVDGVIQPFGFTLAMIDGARIQKIDTVRGAAAVKLYGQRAANGVLNITLKK